MNIDSALENCSSCRHAVEQCIECDNYGCSKHGYTHEDKELSVCYYTCLSCIVSNEEQYERSLDFCNEYNYGIPVDKCPKCLHSDVCCYNCEQGRCEFHVTSFDDDHGEVIYECIICSLENRNYYQGCLNFRDGYVQGS